MSECLVMGDTKMKTAHRRDKHAGRHRSTFGASETKLLLSKLRLCRACVHFTYSLSLLSFTSIFGRFKLRNIGAIP
jgi:hypothetical protein